MGSDRVVVAAAAPLVCASTFILAGFVRALLARPEAEEASPFARHWRQLHERWIPSAYRRHLDSLLQRLGHRDVSPWPLIERQERSALAGAGLLLAVGAMIGRPISLGLTGCLAGASLPYLRLRDRVAQRSARLARELPWHLDLLPAAVESGLDFAQAVEVVARRARPGPLRDEWQRWLDGLRLGLSREEALRDLAGRAALPALSALVAALIQAERHGSRLGRVLRLQAQQLRQERFQRAEKRAGEAPVRMLMPLVLCIFPAVFLVLLGPVVFQLARGLAE